MNYFINKIRTITLVLLILSVFQISHAASLELVILVHKDNPITDISSVDLRRIWLGKISEINGVSINPFSAETQLNSKIVFYKSILNKSRKGLQKYYMREEVNQDFKKPQSLKNIDLLLFEIQTDTTAICFINKTDIPDSLNVKIITVDGKDSGDKDYIIK